MMYNCVEKATPDTLEMPFEIKRKEETNGNSKSTINERVATKVMPLTKWFVEQYFQTYETDVIRS